MMDYATNSYYMKNMQDGNMFEAKKNYPFAIDRYTMAFNLAKNAEDYHTKEPFERIRVCEARMKGLEPNYEEIANEYETLEQNDFKGFSFENEGME